MALCVGTWGEPSPERMTPYELGVDPMNDRWLGGHRHGIRSFGSTTPDQLTPFRTSAGNGGLRQHRPFASLATARKQALFCVLSVGVSDSGTPHRALRGRFPYTMNLSIIPPILTAVTCAVRRRTLSEVQPRSHNRSRGVFRHPTRSTCAPALAGLPLLRRVPQPNCDPEVLPAVTCTCRSDC